MYKNNLVLLSFGVVVSFLLLGCTAKAESGNLESLFFSKKCKGACWMGIEPQFSTTDEALIILENAYGIENVVQESGTISWNAINPNWNNRGYVFTNDNKVSFIMVWFPEPYMIVEDIIFEIGNPESVGLVISGSDVKCAGASLLYPKIGLQIDLSPDDKFVGVADNQIVNGFVINSPWSSGSYPGTDTAVIPWDGYHEYCPEKWSWEE